MVGIDIVFIPEFRSQLELGGNKFLEKAFSPNEYNNKNPEHLAGLWAAKEAVIKASDTVPKKYRDISIYHDAHGKPSAKSDSQKFAISIAHHGDYAVAVAFRMENDL